MKKYYLFNNISLLVLSFILLSSCSVTSTDDHDHEVAVGLQLIENGSEIARQFSGEVTYNGDDHIELIEGEESSLVILSFLNEEGGTFQPHSDEGYFLAWDIDSDNVLEIEQHEEDGAWSFHFVGLAEGHAHIVFLLMHGEPGSAHADFESLEFEIDVEAAL